MSDLTATPVAEAADSLESQQFPYWQENLRILPVANFLCSLGFALSWPFLPLMLRGLGAQGSLETWVGYIMLGFNIIGFAISPIWGDIADHYGRKIMVLRAMLGMGFVMVLVPFARTPLIFAVMVALVGIFYGYMNASMALLVANTPPRRIGSALAYAQTGGMVGQTVGPAVGAMLAALIEQQHLMFWISGGFMLSGGALVAFFVREKKTAVSGPWQPDWVGSLRELLAVPHIAPLFFLAFMFAALWYGNVTIISVYMLQLLAVQSGIAGSEAFWVGAAAAGLAIASTVSMPFWGRALDRFGPSRVLLVAIVAAVLTHAPLPFLQTPLQLVIARLAFGLACAAMLPAIIQLVRMHAPAGKDARAIAYGTSFQCIGIGLMPFFAGMIGPVLGLRSYFAVCTVLTLLGLTSRLRSAGRRQTI
jgi:DHA1 family multidrug resistance protein-like MFS transporter